MKKYTHDNKRHILIWERPRGAGDEHRPRAEERPVDVTRVWIRGLPEDQPASRMLATVQEVLKALVDFEATRISKFEYDMALAAVSPLG